MEFYLLEDLDFHLVVFHPYRALLNICGREPADSGRFGRTRVEEDQEVRAKEEAGRKRRAEEGRGRGPAGGAGRSVSGPATPPAGAGAGTGTGPGQGAGADDDLGAQEEGEADRIRRLMGRGTGEGLMEIEESVLQISL